MWTSRLLIHATHLSVPWELYMSLWELYNYVSVKRRYRYQGSDYVKTRFGNTLRCKAVPCTLPAHTQCTLNV